MFPWLWVLDRDWEGKGMWLNLSASNDTEEEKGSIIISSLSNFGINIISFSKTNSIWYIVANKFSVPYLDSKHVAIWSKADEMKMKHKRLRFLSPMI